jgi:large subunit ribosomal protein L4
MATKPVKTVKKTSPKKAASPVAHKPVGLVASVLGVDGKEAGKITLPESLFGAAVNKQLIAQSVRVFLANQRAGSAKAKTRGMVEGSTRKIYKQKGTGRARHGSIRAPIFVGGGKAHGPVIHDYTLHMTQSMKLGALASALSSKHGEGRVVVVSGFDALKKTKAMAEAFKAVGALRSTLFVLHKDTAMMMRNARNLANVDIVSADTLNPYEVLNHMTVVFTKEAVGESGKHFSK